MLNAAQGFTYNKFQKPNDWPKIEDTFDYKYDNGKLIGGNKNLFLSGPVTYEKVGNPIIKDGVVSGFSSSDYLQLTQNPSYEVTDEIEWNASFTTSSSIATEWIFAFNDPATSAMKGIYYVASRVYVLYCPGKTLDLTYRLQTNTTYFVNFKKDSSGNLIALLKDESGNILKTATQTDANVAMSYNTRRIGLGFSTGNSGSINLNETYIKVNDKLWFYGKNYTTSNMVPVPKGLEYNNTIAPSNGWVYTNSDLVKGSVGYTVVGNPTIVNGVASNLDYSNYCQTTSNLVYNYNDNVKMRFKFKTPSSFDGNWANIVSWLSSNDPIISLYSMSSLNIRPLFYANKGQINIVYNFALNTEYVIELEGSSGKWTAKLIKNEVVVSTATLTTNSGSVNTPVFFGRKYRSTSPGISALDLNHTYIKVNGQPWFGSVSKFQEFIPAPQGTMIGKDDTHSLAVETYQDKGIVDYTIVGSPTIVDGVASNFSNSNYLTLPGSVSTAQEFEIVGGINLNTSSPSGSYVPIFQSNGYGVILCVTSAMKLGAYLSSTGNSWDLANITTFVGTTTLSVNTNYLAKLKKTSTAYELWLKQGNNDWNLEATLSSTATIVSGPLRIGYGSRAFEGSIDLNKTYIKINGNYWFHPYPNSYPKLVGPVSYTVVGSPSIVNGIASGFAFGSYIQTESDANFSQPFEISVSCIKDVNRNVGVFSRRTRNNGVSVQFPYNNRCVISLYLNNSEIYHENELMGGFSLQENVKYIMNFSFDGNDKYYFAVLDGITRNTLYSRTITESTKLGNAGVTFGGTLSDQLYNAWKGYIDLNETYIKVNGKLWFGKEDWTPSTHTDNAIYLLGSHNADYSTYNTQGINPTIETESDESGTYNVWIDNQEIYKEQSNPLDINWNNLALTTGYDITTPSTLKAHVIKVEPNNGNITRFSTDTNYKVENGLLTWASPKLYLEGPTQYTVVGSPTIVDGIASGFSSSDYLQTSNVLSSSSNNIFIKIRFKAPSTVANGSSNICFFGSILTNNNCIRLYKSTSYGIYLAGFGWDLFPGRNLIEENAWHTLDFSSIDGISTATLYDKNGAILASASSSTLQVNIDNVGYFGGKYSQSIDSIDLNHTYIKVNNELWFGKIYTSETHVPVPANFTYGNTTTSSNGIVNLTTQEFSADTLATYGKDS